MGESEHLIINGNSSQNGGSSITKIITSLAVLIIILTFIISIVTLVLIGINYISLNINNNNGGITTNNNYKSIKLNAGQRLNKGAAVTSCSDNIPEKKSVCLFQTFTDRSSILTKNSNYLYNYNDYKVIDTVQDLSNYKVKAYVQHVSNGNNQASQSLVFYALLSLDPIVAYESFALELTVDPFEKPLQPGEFYQLLQVKLFSDDFFQSLYTARFVVSYVRVTDGGKQYSSIIATKNVIVTLTYDTSQMKVITFSRSVTAVGPQYATNVNADLTKEIIDKDKVALGYTKIRYTDFSFALTYERVGRCNVDTFQYVNSQLTFLQNQNSVLTCGKGLKSFYYNENTFLLMDMNNLMSVSIDPTNGNVAQNAVERVMLNYNPILLSINTKVMYVGMQHSSNHTIQSQREYVGVYFNTDTNYASVMKILFDGTKFTTNRIVSLQKPMKNLQISLLSDNNFYQLTYEREGLIKTCIMTFEEETPSDYTYFVPSLGVEFTVGTISPQVTNLIVSDYCALLSDNCLNLIQRKDNTVFDIAAFDIPSNSFPILGVALNDADFGMEVEVAFSGIVDIYSNLKTGKKYYALEYYSSKSNLLEGGLTVSGTFGDYEADFVGVAISDKQLLLRNLEDKR